MSRKLNKEWYAAFHNTDNAKDKQCWDEMLNYAKALGIPDSQLDVLPPESKTEIY